MVLLMKHLVLGFLTVTAFFRREFLSEVDSARAYAEEQLVCICLLEYFASVMILVLGLFVNVDWRQKWLKALLIVCSLL